MTDLLFSLLYNPVRRFDGELRVGALSDRVQHTGGTAIFSCCGRFVSNRVREALQNC
jgi:hypothetical protein